MSVERHPSGFQFICDACGQYVNPPRSTEALSFQESLDLAKEKGWRAVQVHSKTGGKDWEHRCSSC